MYQELWDEAEEQLPQVSVCPFPAPAARETCLPAVIAAGSQSTENKGVLEPRGQGLLQEPAMVAFPSAEPQFCRGCPLIHGTDSARPWDARGMRRSSRGRGHFARRWLLWAAVLSPVSAPEDAGFPLESCQRAADLIWEVGRG